MDFFALHEKLMLSHDSNTETTTVKTKVTTGLKNNDTTVEKEESGSDVENDSNLMEGGEDDGLGGSENDSGDSDK